MADQCNKFPCVVPERDFRTLIEDRLNVLGPPMQEEALGRGQFVGANTVFVARLAHPADYDFSLHGSNGDSSRANEVSVSRACYRGPEEPTCRESVAPLEPT